MELIVVLIALFFSFFFAGFETGFISLDYITVLYLVKIEKDKSFKKILHLFNKKELVIAILLVGNNLAVIIATIFYNIFLYKMFKNIDNPEVIIPLISVFTLTPIFFFFGELLPKSLYKTYPYLMVRRSYNMFIFVYTVLYIPSYFFYIVSKIIMKIIHSIFNKKSGSIVLPTKNHLSTVLNEIDPLVINNLVEHEIDMRKFFVKISKSQIYQSSEKISAINVDKLPIFVSYKEKIVGVITKNSIPVNKNIKLRFAYSKINFFENFDKVDILKMNYSYSLTKENEFFYYTSKERFVDQIFHV